MTTYDARNADIFVFARRQSGTLLSRMGHDLKLQVSRFEIDADLSGGSVTAHIDAASLEPVDAIKWEDREETGELHDGDRHEIKQRLNKQILEVDDFPDIEFRSTRVEETNDGWRVTGDLELHGERHEVEFDVSRNDGQARVETVIDHTNYGIEPYSAMLGSLKVAPKLLVVVELSLDED